MASLVDELSDLVDTCASAPDDTSTLQALEKAKPVILFWCPCKLAITCKGNGGTNL